MKISATHKLSILGRLLLLMAISMAVGAVIGFERGVDSSRQLIKQELAK